MLPPPGLHHLRTAQRQEASACPERVVPSPDTTPGWVFSCDSGVPWSVFAGKAVSHAQTPHRQCESSLWPLLQAFSLLPRHLNTLFRFPVCHQKFHHRSVATENMPFRSILAFLLVVCSDKNLFFSWFSQIFWAHHLSSFVAPAPHPPPSQTPCAGPHWPFTATAPSPTLIRERTGQLHS